MWHVSNSEVRDVKKIIETICAIGKRLLVKETTVQIYVQMTRIKCV